ncbi:DUF7619 domain-containing protein [Flavobacterium sp. SM2513]|uniref:DUF7619 domain-containing protein n=1 Tax=Flavobacterium sp. SM2513 TaxID=3424766 RepID=UPI003D7FA057
MKKYYLLLVVLMGFGSVSGQNPSDIVFIPDTYLKARLLEANSSTYFASTQSHVIGYSPSSYNSIDVNNDGQIQYSEAAAIKWLNIGGTFLSNLTGLQSFVNLQYLNVGYSPYLIYLNIGYLPNLTQLDCKYSNLASLSINSLSNLQYLNCDGNNLFSIDISNLTNLNHLSIDSNDFETINLDSLTNLQKLFCDNNQLTNLNLSTLTNLKVLRASNNQLTSLDMTGLNNLNELAFNYNQLNSINVSGLSNLKSLYCSFNQLTSINLIGSNLHFFYCNNNLLNAINIDGLVNLQYLNCNDNQINNVDASSCRLYSLNCFNNLNLSSINIKNGYNTITDFSNCPNLQYICADDFELANIETLIADYNYEDCHVNSYCSFIPGGIFYTVAGNIKFDSNNNTSCDTNDENIINQKLYVTNGITSTTLITNQNGNFNIPVQAGTHTITPVLENPTYFNISANSATVTFPDTTSPFTLDFCITPNGFHQDLDVTIIPMGAAIPGFDAHYKIVYRNIGNVNIAMGSMAFNYDDATLDYVSSAPTTEVLPLGNLFWTFLNLQPFETRTIDVVFNLNSPTETPALNSGSMLSFSANVDTSVGEDTNPIDNLTTLQQLVVNSFDPNDKTCLEGTSITPDMIGKYVHYMIRFENTGTFPAQNIVVKDMIDETKFDVASLIPLNASHDYITRITGNKVEFIFEGINLPFDDANNDGYIVFKIKTLPTLALGDTFSNSASIYFDYNFPIITEPAVTTFATLATQDFVFNNYLTVYPNPTNDALNLTAKQAIELKSMEVYNVVGQLVLSVPNAKGVSTVDVSNLTTGTYFLKVLSDKGTSNVKFMKK